MDAIHAANVLLRGTLISMLLGLNLLLLCDKSESVAHSYIHAS